MIKEAYCSFEVAKLLKEKGFLKNVELRLIPNLAFYTYLGLQYNIAKWYDSLIQDKIDFVIAPTHQMAMSWLREKYNIIFVIKPATFSGDSCTSWAFELWCGDNYEGEMCAFKTYEEAVERALKYYLENLENLI